jgi:hypothetical protein
VGSEARSISARRAALGHLCALASFLDTPLSRMHSRTRPGDPQLLSTTSISARPRRSPKRNRPVLPVRAPTMARRTAPPPPVRAPGFAVDISTLSGLDPSPCVVPHDPSHLAPETPTCGRAPPMRHIPVSPLNQPTSPTLPTLTWTTLTSLVILVVFLCHLWSSLAPPCLPNDRSSSPP